MIDQKVSSRSSQCRKRWFFLGFARKIKNEVVLGTSAGM
jgi:hypothetical protein